jgi:eukaryotic-like serine/threonine-protein kinase
LTQLKRFIGEIHRRSLWQVLGIYLVGSWGVLQVVDSVTDSAGLPDWTPGLAFVLLLIGLPIVMATAFVQEGAPGREPKPEAPSAEADTETAATTAPNLSGETGSLDGPTTRPSAVKRFLTWRRAVMGGVGAVALLTLSTVAYVVMWSTGVGPIGNLVAQGAIEEGATMVVSDFESPGSDIGEVITEALRVDLAASPIINLVPPAQVHSALGRMGLEPDVAVTEDVAKEIAVRDGYATVLTGRVSAVGGGYVLTASIVASESGEILAPFRVTAETESDVLGALDELSQDIREKSGESLRSIRAGEPLEIVTTGSLRALRLYGRAVRLFDAGDESGAATLLEEAIEVDPEFAMAHRKLAVALSNDGVPPGDTRIDEAATRAFELRDRLTERERGLAEAYYYSTAGHDAARAKLAYERILERYPDDPTALNNLALLVLNTGDFEKGSEILERAVQGPFPIRTAYQNLVRQQAVLGRFDAAKQTLDSMEVRYPGATAEVRSVLASHQLHFSEAHALYEEPMRSARGPFDRFGLLRLMALADLGRGRWGEAMDHLDEMDQIALGGEQYELYLTLPTTIRALAEFGVRGDVNAARGVMDGALARMPDGFQWSWTGGEVLVTITLSLIGEVDRAEEIWAERPTPPDDEPDDNGHFHAAMVALGSGRPADAVKEFERLTPSTGAYIGLIRYGLALEQLGRTDEAIEAIESQLAYWIDEAGFMILPLRPLAFDRLGHLYESKGDIASAAQAYQRLLDEMNEPDATMQSIVANARRRIEELTAEGG